MANQIYKRDGRLCEFEPKKISDAVHSAFSAIGVDDSKILAIVTSRTFSEIERRFHDRIPSVEDVQDIVGQVLMKSGYERTAKAYIEYKLRQPDRGEAKKIPCVSSDELKLGLNAARVLEKRYLLKDDSGRVVETPSQMFRRVARAVAAAEIKHDRKNAEQNEEAFYNMMANMDFIPNSPTLMNAGTRIGQLSACFVLPIEDSIESIFTTLKQMALIHRSGGGTGFSFSRLRPYGDIVSSTKSRASGPVSFIHAYNTATDVVKQGGRRRGANMAVLRIDHPDIIKFITAKKEGNTLQNFNISVAVTDEFVKRLDKGLDIELINPRDNSVAGKLNTRDVFRLMATMAWHCGDPGIIFIDEINRHNPTPSIGEIESTNPCGEQPLLPYESCNLGSINLSRFVARSDIDWKRLELTVRLAVRFLDDVIDANIFTLHEIEKITKANRKIGLGVMGFADLLVKLRVPYDSEQAVRMAGRVMKFIHETARDESCILGRQRGNFPNFRKSRLYGKWKNMRNASVTTVAPTGTISIIAGCSSGIEPLFGISFVRNVMGGARLVETNTDFEAAAKLRGFYSTALVREVAKHGSVQNIAEVPADLKRIFVTAHDIEPEWHIRIQAEFQKHTDSAVSKTINFPSGATISDIEDAFIQAYKLKCKGITVYRYGSREGQVLSYGNAGSKQGFAHADAEYSGGCPGTECLF
jgi:ribonucleoside-diphosphate reductase alpha chain